jgi:hypothetical protein
MSKQKESIKYSKKSRHMSRTESNIKENPENSDYLPVIYKLPNIKDDILKYKISPEFSPNIDYPRFSLGFHHYIHQNKDKMEIIKEFENKKKVYFVMSKFERYIDDYKYDIGHISKAYFDIEPKPDILSRAFYKIWELFFMFDLVSVDKPKFISAHLAEGPGSFIQATMFYRDKFGTKSVTSKDKYHAVTLHPEEYKENIQPLENKFIEYYKKENPIRFVQHRTYPRKIARTSSEKDNGDLTDPKTIKLFSDNFIKDKAHLVTADGGFHWKNENIQEQEAMKLILAQIVLALKIQAIDGNFVCKIFESFTQTTLKFIAILCSLYNEVYIVKPIMSRKSNSEKYAVCIGYKGTSEKNINNIESVLELALTKKNENIVNLFPEFEIPVEFRATMIKLNTAISNRQLVSINEIVDFIQQQNYRGDVYHERRQEQINATQYWLDRFFVDKSKFETLKKNIKNDTVELIKKNDKKIDEILKIINK